MAIGKLGVRGGGLGGLGQVTSKHWWLNGSAVDLNFAGGNYFPSALSGLISTSRASTGYATNKDGTLTLFQANQPRIGIGTGLLVEEARTNLAFQSQAMTTSPWATFFGLTIAPSAVVEPTGGTNAFLIQEGTSVGSAFILNQVINGGTTSGANYTLSAFVKAGTSNFVCITAGSSADGTKGIAATFDLGAGALGNTAVGVGGGTIVSTSITPLVNGWYRISITGSVNATDVQITLSTSGSATPLYGVAGPWPTYAGNSTRNVLVFGADFELGAFATSYIPTTTVAVTRAADVVSLIGSAQTALQGSAWSYVLSIGPMARNDVGSRLIGDSVNNFVLYIASATSVSAFPGGNAVTVNSLPTLSNKIAQAQSGTTQSMVANGGAVNSSASLNLTPAISYLGGDNGADPYPNGYFKRATLWTTRLADATLQAQSV